jgi:hypothetical protein
MVVYMLVSSVPIVINLWADSIQLELAQFNRMWEPC